MQMEQFFRVLIGWANEGKTDAAGLPTLLRAAVLHHHFRRSIRSRSRTRRILSWLLAPLGALAGHRRDLLRHLG